MARVTGWTMREVQEHSTRELLAYAQALQEEATLRRMEARKRAKGR